MLFIDIAIGNLCSYEQCRHTQSISLWEREPPRAIRNETHAHAQNDKSSNDPATFASPLPPAIGRVPSVVALDSGLVGDGGNGLGAVVLHGDGALLTGHEGLSLELKGLALNLGLLLQLSVRLDTANEVLS